MLAQEWQDAQHEWERLIFYSGSQSLPTDRMALADCLLASESYDAALDQYRSAYRLCAKGSALRDTAILRGAFVALLAERPNEGLALLKEHAQSWTNAQLRREGAILQALILNYRGDFGQSHAILASEFSGDQGALTRIDSAYAKPLRYKPKKVGTALVLSVVLPGSGQAFGGAAGDGLLSTVMVGGTATLGVVSFIQGHYFFAFLTCLPYFQKFYEGGARYAMKRAEQWNENRKTDMAKRLNDWLIVQLVPAGP
jgi:hypothetical protein